MKPAVVFLPLAFFAAACDKVPEPESHPRVAISKEPETPEIPDLAIEELKVGAGAEAKKGDKVFVHYTGKLAKNGKQFDSSVGKEPLDFVLGEGGVIEGWEKGVVGMKPGGKRKLTIPSRLAYKEEGHPPNIPPKATLVFDVELVRIGDEKKEPAEEKKDATEEKKDAEKKEPKDAKKDPSKKEPKAAEKKPPPKEGKPAPSAKP